MVSLQRKSLQLKNFNNLHLVVEKVTIHNMSARHKRGILELKVSYAHVILGPRNTTKEFCNVIEGDAPLLRIFEKGIKRKDKKKNKYNVGFWMRASHLVRCGKHACNLSLGLGVKHNLRLEQTK